MSSINHHYVPQLYLRGFIAESGRIQAFDKYLNSFKKDKQTPRTILFEKHRSTITHRGVRTDALEKLYGTIEAPLGQFFDLVRKGLSANELISKEGIYLLKVFVAFQFWRMPLLDPFVEQYIKTLDLKRFGNRITLNGVNIGDCDQIKSALENDSGFRHYFRNFMLPLLTFDFRLHDSDYESWKVHHVSPVQNLAMDLGPLFTTYLAMATYNQCHRYVVGTNKDYIEQIKLFLGSEVEPSDLRAELFTYI
ncbi:DUF4238 domain-containing protein [Vibrio alginolyticus]|nr:DUF4238 domain-containing protein [Vibrio alginolyticus]